MKKIYSKPEILFEDFTVSTNIASGCEVQISNQAQGNCAYNTRADGGIFVTGVTGCETVPPDGQYNSICYHVPIESNNLFNS